MKNAHITWGKLSVTGLVVVILIAGCATIADIGAGVGEMAGVIDSDQADAIRETGASLEKATEDITPEQEYYLGRSVAGLILRQYSPLENESANLYINTLGQSLAALSSRPEIFKGYRFLILDSDEINAFASPGGHIMVSRGMINLARDEDMLAAVLAHEISHIVYQHGLESIKAARWADTGKSLGVLALEMADDDSQLGELTDIFGESLLDVTATLLTDGYGQQQEFQADQETILMLTQMGYDPWALVDVLEQLERFTDPGQSGFGTTHPNPEDRIREASNKISTPRRTRSANAARARRFQILANL
jgi:predicted Zn-dependent protease